MEPIKIVCLTKQDMFEVALCFEEDTAKWLCEEDGSEVLRLLYHDQAWWIAANNRLRLAQGKVKYSYAYEIRWEQKPALLYMTSPSQESLHYSFYALPKQRSIVIGRKQGDIRYDHALISATHARIAWEEQEWILEDLHSTNGVYVNHRRKQRHVLQVGDCIDLMGLQLLFGVDFIAINHTDVRISASLSPYEKQSHHQGKPPIATNMSIHASKPFTPYEIPPIRLMDPPPNELRERQPLIYLLGPSLTMCLGSMASSFFMIYNSIASGQSLLSVIPTGIMALSMLCASLLWPLLMHRFERRKEHTAIRKRKDCYNAYLHRQQALLQEQLHRKEENLRTLYRTREDASLWCHTLSHDELCMCLGIGDEMIQNPFLANEQPLRIETDEVMEQRDAFLQASCTLHDVPILRHCIALRVFAVHGSKSCSLAYARYLLLHHALLYPPKSALVLLAFSKGKQEIPRFLPHLFNEAGYRFLCCDVNAMPDVLMHLKQEQLPILALSFVPAITSYLLRYGKKLAMALFAFHPCEEAENHLEVTKGQVIMNDQCFRWQTDRNFDEMMRLLCNTSYEQVSFTFPRQLSFFAMYRHQHIAQFQIAKRWQKNHPSGSLCAAIGVLEDGAVMYLDLHERAHGPHGIVAGMTGSGKSELLITLLLSLACNYHPFDCAFILIDYKGGGMAKALKRLPHTAGIITNLDGNTIVRSLQSLHAEVLRRQRIFAQTMDEQGYPSMNIDLYQTLYHAHQVCEIIPHLVIVADEFAELKQQEPQFMEQLIRIARIGRSLGIHLILATQKPNGVVDDQIWSNARFHICLKVADTADSMDMLKRKEGAQIKAVGRFYLQVGYDELFLEGQCAYAKAPYDPDCEGIGSVLLREIKEDGSMIREWKRDAANPMYQSEMDVLTDAMCKIAEAQDAYTPHLWLAPLTDALTTEDVEKGVIALADDVKHQRQFPLHIQDQEHNTLFLAQEMQEANAAIQTWIHALIDTTSYETYHVVIFDGENGSLCPLQDNPYVYAALSLEDTADILFVMHKLITVKKTGGEGHRWLLIIHNVNAFLEQYENGLHWLITLAKDHGNQGILVLLTAMSCADIPTRLYRQFENLFLFHLQDETEMRMLIGSQHRIGKGKLRAMWKHQDQIYEVQLAKSIKTISALTNETKMQKPAIKMPILPEILRYQDFADETMDAYVIGLSLLTRERLLIASHGVWLFTGYEYERQITLWKQIAKTKADIHFLDTLDDIRDVGMEIIALAPNQLSLYFHHPKFVSLRENGHVLWFGNGFEDQRYLWNITEVPSINRYEGLWLKEEVIPFLSMSER